MKLIVGILACLMLPRAAQSDSYIDKLKEIAEVNSYTHNVVGLEVVRAKLKPVFENLGFNTHVHACGEGHKVLHFAFAEEAPSLALIGHIDTVFPHPGTVRSDGDYLYGPGVIDMKGGVVMMAHVLSHLPFEQRKKVTIILNDDEEIGSPYSKPTLKRLTKGLKYGLIFEPGLEDGAVVRAHRGVRRYDIAIEGVAAHSGLEPEKGSNACTTLARVIARIHRMLKPFSDISFNLGTISGGQAINVVCPLAKASIEFRHEDETQADVIEQKIANLLKHLTQDAQNSTLSKSLHLAPMRVQDTDAIYRALKTAGTKIKQPVAGRAVGYGSDGNHLAQNGLNLLVGLGPYGGGMHTDQEKMSFKAYEERLILNVALIKELLQRKGLEK